MKEPFDPFRPFKELHKEMGEMIVFLGHWPAEQQMAYNQSRGTDREWLQDVIEDAETAFESVGQSSIEEAYAEWLEHRRAVSQTT